MPINLGAIALGKVKQLEKRVSELEVALKEREDTQKQMGTSVVEETAEVRPPT